MGQRSIRSGGMDFSTLGNPWNGKSKNKRLYWGYNLKSILGYGVEEEVICVLVDWGRV